MLFDTLLEHVEVAGLESIDVMTLAVGDEDRNKNLADLNLDGWRSVLRCPRLHRCCERRDAEA